MSSALPGLRRHSFQRMSSKSDILYRISPTITRIILSYRHWQPLYDELKKTVWPPIEFIQGIPVELGYDTFISPKENNIIILDDLMSTAAKDARITDLFTEGSHHRNLSVISINQNLYHSKDPTQRRNCHYLTLFRCIQKIPKNV